MRSLSHKQQQNYLGWLNSHPVSYFVTMYFGVNLKSRQRMENIVVEFSNVTERFLFGRHGTGNGKHNYTFIPVIEHGKRNEKPHVHISIGGELKPHLTRNDVKTGLANIWASIDGTMPVHYHDSDGEAWFQDIECANDVINYQLKDIDNNEDKLVLKAVRLKKSIH